MKLSIITINRNNAAGLRKTMESVFAQTFRDFEYIVVDGASSDDSVDIIKEYAQKLEIGDCKLENLQWISEPDGGIYEAMNKGIEIAEGKRVVNSFNRSEPVEDKNKDREDGYVLMLNSGDFLVDEHVIERIIPELHTEDMIQGNTIKDYPDGTVRYRGYGRSEISFLDAKDAQFPHQATFIKLATMEKYGYYEDKYKKAADTYFFTTALGFGNATFRYVDIDITNFDVNGISSMTDPMWRKIDREEDAIWYGEHFSERLNNFCESSRKKGALYDKLHRNKVVWRIAWGLARLADWISPTPPNVIIEKLK